MQPPCDHTRANASIDFFLSLDKWFSKARVKTLAVYYDFYEHEPFRGYRTWLFVFDGTEISQRVSGGN